MNVTSSQIPPVNGSSPSGKRRAILLTTYMTGATSGENLGVAGYSYDFVTQLFLPLLQRWGEVIPVPDPAVNLDGAVADAQALGFEPVHVSFLPFQDVTLARSVPNIVVPAWEFPDVPNEAFAGRTENDWIAMANRCAIVLVGGPFTVNAFRKGGATTPIQVVQVPVADSYFSQPHWRPSDSSELNCSCYEFVNEGPRGDASCPENLADRPKTPSMLKRTGKAIERGVRGTFKGLFGQQAYQRLKMAGINILKMANPKRRKPIQLPYPRKDTLNLSGVVYTSIFNPNDGRKNWQDLLTGFLLTLGDCEDATLVLKLITSDVNAVQRLIHYYKRRDIRHRCKLAVITDYLSDEQMCQLAGASTYYLQTTKAEGNCLPLMNFLGAGRPGISPAHSAIADYFDEEVGFVVESHPEPAAWPHDPYLRTRTSWGRIVWPSLCEQIRKSYELAKQDASAYQALGEAARSRLRSWASVEEVWKRLQESLDKVLGNGMPATSTSNPTTRRAAA